MLEEGLSTFLRANAAIVAVLSTRSYPVRLPQNVPLPAASYRRSGTSPEVLLDEDGLHRAIIEIAVWDAEYLNAKSVALVVRNELRRVENDLGGWVVRNVSWINEEDTYDEEAIGGSGLFGIVETFEILTEGA